MSEGEKIRDLTPGERELWAKYHRYAQECEDRVQEALTELQRAKDMRHDMALAFARGEGPVVVDGAAIYSVPKGEGD